jgi:hypothetical protein
MEIPVSRLSVVFQRRSGIDAPLPRRLPAEYHDHVKTSILAALLLAWAFPAAAQTNHPDVPIPRQENQLWRQQQIEAFVRDQLVNDLIQQQEMTSLQQQIDSLDNVTQADLNRLQQGLDRLQYAQQLQRFEAARRTLLIDQQGDTARRRRWAAQLARDQLTQRLEQRRRLADIEQELRRFSGQ